MSNCVESRRADAEQDVSAQCGVGVDDDARVSGASEKPGFFHALRICICEKYCRFSGRASRREFWFFMLWLAFFWHVVASVEILFRLPWPLAAFYLAVFLPTMSVTIRRLHDTGLPNWFILSFYLSVLAADAAGFALWLVKGPVPQLLSTIEQMNKGFITMHFLVLCLPGTRGPNRFGPAHAKGPKSAERPFSSAVSAAFAKSRSLRPTSRQDGAPCPPDLHSPNSRSQALLPGDDHDPLFSMRKRRSRARDLRPMRRPGSLRAYRNPSRRRRRVRPTPSLTILTRQKYRALIARSKSAW